MVRKFVSEMPAIDSKFIRNEYARITPNIDLRQNFECSKCYSSTEIEIPFTADFFWPK